MEKKNAYYLREWWTYLCSCEKSATIPTYSNLGLSYLLSCVPILSTVQVCRNFFWNLFSLKHTFLASIGNISLKALARNPLVTISSTMTGTNQWILIPTLIWLVFYLFESNLQISGHLEKTVFIAICWKRKYPPKQRIKFQLTKKGKKRISSKIIITVVRHFIFAF